MGSPRARPTVPHQHPPHHPCPGALSALPSSALGAAGAALPLPTLPDRPGRVTKGSERGSCRALTEQKEADAGEQMEPLEQDRPPPAQSPSPAILDPAPSPSRGRELGQTLLQPSWEPGWSWDRHGEHPRKGDRWTDGWMEHMDPPPQLPPCALTAQGYSRIRPPRHPGVLPRAQGAARSRGKVWRQTLTALLPCLTPRHHLLSGLRSVPRFVLHTPTITEAAPCAPAQASPTQPDANTHQNCGTSELGDTRGANEGSAPLSISRVEFGGLQRLQPRGAEGWQCQVPAILARPAPGPSSLTGTTGHQATAPGRAGGGGKKAFKRKKTVTV